MALNPAFTVCVERKPGAFGDTMKRSGPGWITAKSNQHRSSRLPKLTAALGLRSASTARVRRTFSSKLFASQPGSPSFANAGRLFFFANKWLRSPAGLQIAHRECG